MRNSLLFSVIAILIATSFRSDGPSVGSVIDVYNDVAVYYNGPYYHVAGRNTTRDGYNLGLKYQCVEYIKRYYYERFNHKMPDSYGHAVDFFDQSKINDVAFNSKRGLFQYWNGNTARPKAEDILVFKTKGDIWGHIGIVSKVTKDQVEMVQQNYGEKSRVTFPLKRVMGRYYVDDQEVLGWLSRY